MKILTFSTIAATLVLAGLTPLRAQDRIGGIVYMEDEVEIDRNSATIQPWDVYIGMEVENYDLFHTNGTGFAEVEVRASRSAPTSVKISPNTTFYFELNRIAGKQTTTVGLVTGSLAVKVAKHSANQNVEVVTESALMGVRGTSFDVTLSPGGDILVASEEGRVSCIDDNGRELFARPGIVVEKQPGELFREIPVAVSELETFRRDWYADRLEVFKANALKAIRSYARRYLRLKEQFDAAYDGLQRNSQVLGKWYEEDRKGQIGSRMELMREKKQLIGELFELRKVLYIFERVYFRLAELEDYFRQGYGAGQVQPGLSTGAFFGRFDEERKDLDGKMVGVRYIIKLYSKRNNGVFPTDLFEQEDSELFSESDGGGLSVDFPVGE